MAFARFLRAASSGGVMPRYGSGVQRRDFTYVGDIVAGLVAAVERGRRGVTYNLGTGRSVALVDALALLAEVAGCAPPSFDPVESQVDEPLSTCGDLSRSAAELGYRPDTALRDGLARQVAATARPTPAEAKPVHRNQGGDGRRRAETATRRR
jgi:UDP-glucuronate 4-epimerase